MYKKISYLSFQCSWSIKNKYLTDVNWWKINDRLKIQEQKFCYMQQDMNWRFNKGILQFQTHNGHFLAKIQSLNTFKITEIISWVKTGKIALFLY